MDSRRAVPNNVTRNALILLAAIAILIIAGLAGSALTRSQNQSTPRISPKDGKVMVRVPAGEFRIGTSAEQATLLRAQPDLQLGDIESEMPQTTITLPEFYIDQTVVTNAEYKKFIDTNPSRAVPFLENALAGGFNWDKASRTPPRGQEQQPVVLVTWQDAVAYCQWAGKHLPTEAEWEKAARGTDNRIWPWGNAPSESHKSDITSIPPSTSKASPYGVLEMVGNIWQWTSSLDKPYSYDANDGRESLNAPGMRVIRGGNRLISIGATRAASRGRFDPNSVSLTIGFRCAQ